MLGALSYRQSPSSRPPCQPSGQHRTTHSGQPPGSLAHACRAPNTVLHDHDAHTYIHHARRRLSAHPVPDIPNPLPPCMAGASGVNMDEHNNIPSPTRVCTRQARPPFLRNQPYLITPIQTCAMHPSTSCAIVFVVVVCTALLRNHTWHPDTSCSPLVRAPILCWPTCKTHLSVPDLQGPMYSSTFPLQWMANLCSFDAGQESAPCAMPLPGRVPPIPPLLLTSLRTVLQRA